MSRLVFLTIVAALIGGSWCYSGGAPEEVCDDMTPKHPADPQTSEMPYTVSLSKKAVKAGETVQLTVAGKNPFKGFLLQVRDGDKSVGQFKIDGADKFAKTINCHSGKSNAATHKNSVDKNNLVVEWVAPADKKTYTVYATVAENGGVYWVHKKVGSIQVE